MEVKNNGPIRYLYCHNCGKQVSTGFVPIMTDTPDKGLIVRAWISCPECIELDQKRLDKIAERERDNGFRE